jgi:hypothetical protein
MRVRLLVNYVSTFFIRGCVGVRVWVWEFKHVRAPVQGLVIGEGVGTEEKPSMRPASTLPVTLLNF